MLKQATYPERLWQQKLCGALVSAYEAPQLDLVQVTHLELLQLTQQADSRAPAGGQLV